MEQQKIAQSESLAASQSAMRAIRYGDVNQLNDIMFQVRSQSAMRAIRYGATIYAYKGMECRCRNPLCVQLDMEKYISITTQMSQKYVAIRYACN